MPPIRMIVLGAGARGMNAYAPYSEEYPQKLQIAAVAEPVAARRSGTVVDVGEYTRRYEKAVEKEEALFICEGGQ